MQLYLSLLLSSSNAIYWNNLLLHCVAGGCVWKSSAYLQIHMTLYIKTHKELSIYLRLENADGLAGSATRCQALQNWSFPGLKESSGFVFFLAFLAPREGGQAVGGCRQRLMAVGPGRHRGAAHRGSSSLWDAGIGTHAWHSGARSQLSCSKLLQGEGLVQRNFYLLWASLPAVKLQWRIGPQVCSLCWLEENFPNQHGPFSWCSQPRL